MSEIARRCRYDERDEMFKLAQDNSDYITDSEIDATLDSLNTHGWEELTFVFIEHTTGFRTYVTNINTDEPVLLENLNHVAWDYYMRKLTELSIDKAKREMEKSQSHIDQIRNDLISKGAAYHDKRFAKYNLHNRNDNKQPQSIAQ